MDLIQKKPKTVKNRFNIYLFLNQGFILLLFYIRNKIFPYSNFYNINYSIIKEKRDIVFFFFPSFFFNVL